MKAVYLTDTQKWKENETVYIIPKKIIERSKKLFERRPLSTAVVLFKEKGRRRIEKVI